MYPNTLRLLRSCLTSGRSENFLPRRSRFNLSGQTQARPDGHRRWPFALFAIISALCLGGCGPQWPAADWSTYLSKEKTLRFVARASCFFPPGLNPVGGEEDFSQVTSLRPVPAQPWSYDFEYISVDGPRRDRLEVVQWWALKATRYAPSKTYSANVRCGVLVDLPESKNADRPYYQEDASAKTAEYQPLHGLKLTILLWLGAFLGSALIPCVYGFRSRGAEERWFISLAAAAAVVGISFAAGQICIEQPWQTFQTAQRYYGFFDALQRSWGGLLPLSGPQLYFLIAGPPHPHDTQFAFAAYAWISGALGAAWLIVHMPFIVVGLYWICTPLPLEEAHKRAVAEGRRLTDEEIMAAMQQTVLGKSAWQLRVMESKARAFAGRFGYVSTPHRT